MAAAEVSVGFAEEEKSNKTSSVVSEELEDGEILVDESESLKPSIGNLHQPHPLEHSWTFWFDNPSAKSKTVPWGVTIRPVHTFHTVEEFWRDLLRDSKVLEDSGKQALADGRASFYVFDGDGEYKAHGTDLIYRLYNNIHHPSKLAVGADFHCFKHKIEPKWEDPICSNGGKWTISFQRGKSDTAWLNTLLAIVGEQFDNGDEICGAVVNVRGKQEKISIWTKNAANESAQMSIGKQWKEFLDYNDSIGFIVHEDAMKQDRFAKNRYTI